MKKRQSGWKGSSDQFRWIRMAAAGLLCALLVGPGATTLRGQAAPEQSLLDRGIVVETITEGSALKKAGLVPDDLLLTWERLPNPPMNPEGAQGVFHSPFDWEWVKFEQAPRGAVRIRGEHRGEPRVWTVEPGLWKAKVRPTIPAPRLAAYLRGHELIAAGDLENGTLRWERLADSEEVGPFKCWLYLRLGDAFFEKQAWKKAHTAYRAALESTHEPVAQVTVWDAMGRIYRSQSDFDQAKASYHAVLVISREAWGESLGLAYGLHSLGVIAWLRGQLDEAAAPYRQALLIRQRLAPGSLDVAKTLNNLGNLAWARGQLDAAAKHHQQALLIRQKLAPQSLDVAASLNNLGNLTWTRGHLDLAVNHYEQALEIKQKLAPQSLDVAMSLNNLGVVAHQQGRFDVAAEHHQNALAIRQRLAPESLDVAASLNNLGVVARRRGQLDEEVEYHRQALEIKQKLAPGSLDVAASLTNLGSVAYDRGQLDEAVEHYQRALRIQQKLAPGGLDMATTINSLGLIAYDRGQLDEAAEHHRRALEMISESHTVASNLNSLGRVAWKQGQLDEAAEYHQRALEILQDTLAPDSLDVAKTLNALGRVAEDRGELDLAEGYFDRSLDVLKAQIGKLGGSQWVQGGFRAQYQNLYRDYIELLLKRGRPEKAFAILERSRARSFLAMLEERELVFKDIPEDLDRQRRGLAHRHDRTLRQMASLRATENLDRGAALQAELNSIYRERDGLRAKIRRQSPHLANLQDPQPLDLKAVREILEPGTVMLSYSVGEEQTALFIVAPNQGFYAHTLPFGEDQLRHEVQELRSLIEKTTPESSLGLLRKSDLERLSKRLYEHLIEPAQDAVAASERVLLVPDGPLHLLPFGALIRPTGPESRDGQYLAAWKPLHSVLSATVYAELKKSRHRAGQYGASQSTLLASFGDPHYPQSLSPKTPQGVADVWVRSFMERGLFDDLTQLPNSRREVLEIAALFPPQGSRAYLGQEATEERAKALHRATRIVHFATHGYLDDRLPLNSGLALSMPEGFPEDRDNGLLQVWEIFEGLRLDADLVVLSACETALGQEQAGEGLIGLTRAFQYAGARTVAASLWSVQDRATAELMVRFHRHLRAGRPKDEALRAAQLELLQGPIEIRGEDGPPVRRDFSAPFYWAGFQILGDWR